MNAQPTPIRQDVGQPVATFANPLGIDGFEFVDTDPTVKPAPTEASITKPLTGRAGYRLRYGR